MQVIMYLLSATVYNVYVTNYRPYKVDIQQNEIKQKFIHFVLFWERFYVEINEKYTVYTARLQPDNRDIQIMGGWITKVQL